jgi:hypothetical protein
MGYLTMNDKEREQAKVFEQVKLGIITQIEAAARLKISDRWVRAKIKRYYDLGDNGLIHKNRGILSPRRWAINEENFLIELIQGEWRDFGPTFASEKLEELHGIKISREVIRKAMIRAKLWAPRQMRNKHRKRRERRLMFGIMIQLDGSPHDWFEGRGKKCTLLVFIDDATSKILWLEFVESETVEALMQATKNYIEVYGIPQSFYVDHGSVFHVNLNNKENEKKTQWELACERLGIEVKHAHSPQAKGRVERCNQTMQDRLSKELRLQKISTIADANEYIRTSKFIERHNSKFAKQPTQQGDAHRDWKSFNLDEVFSLYETRKLANDFTIMYHKKIFQLHKEQSTIIRPKNEITVRTSLNGSTSLWIRKVKLFFSEISHKPLAKIEEKTVAICKPRKPSENSRRWVNGLLPV